MLKCNWHNVFFLIYRSEFMIDMMDKIDNIDNGGENFFSINIDQKYMNDDADFNIVSIFGKEKLEEIQNIISEVTGLAFVTVDYKGDPLTECTKFTNFCKNVRKDKSKEFFCKLSDASGAISAAVSRNTGIYFCPCGLLEVAIPIIVNDRYLGGFIGGQIRCDDAPEGTISFKKYSTHGDKSRFDDETQRLWDQIPKYTYSEFKSITKMVKLIIGLLVKKEVISEHHQLKNEAKISELTQKLDKARYDLNNMSIQLEDFKRYTTGYYRRNLINTISGLAVMEGAAKTKEAIDSFNHFLENKYNTDNYNKMRIEIEQMRLYLQYTKIRFENRFEYELNIELDDNTLDKVSVPFYFMQTYLQNAVFSGIYYSNKVYRVNISIARENDFISYIIRDDLGDFDSDKFHKNMKVYSDDYEGANIKSQLVKIKEGFNSLFDNYTIDSKFEKEGRTFIVKYPVDYASERDAYV